MARRGAAAGWIVGTVGILGIGVLDYVSGVEINVVPLYYVPLAVLAWHFGRTGAWIATLLCGLTWFSSNRLAGLVYVGPNTWWINTAMMSASFATVGLLIATVRRSLFQERELGRSDPLTGMLNRQGFFEEAERVLALCRRGGRPVTVAYIDLDHFKSVNDERGHAAGDALLCRAADTLHETLRPSDVAGRLGGDEFVVLLPEVSAAEAAPALERIRSALARGVGRGPTRITASIGGAIFEVVPDDVEELIRRADARMYAAKAAGRNRIEVEVASRLEGGVGSR
ncbi:MAG TPA: GGDEF domain-containing protein [Longimicrobiales bacterium]|nr:GGDEF domain-containing protein [Longimicrobiales bacterium]